MVERIGPYHAARLNRAGTRGEVLAIELRADSDTYAWSQIEDAGRRYYHRDTVVEPLRTLETILDTARPDVVFVNGWADHGARRALRWCLHRNVPAVLMSDSQREDEPRVFWKEGVKRALLLAGCRAAFVAGSRHTAYLRALGFKCQPVITGYDVVDNDHFHHGADVARREAMVVRSELGLPQHYFLCVSRFVPKKNILTLLRAFAAYRQVVGAAGWALVLLGDGAERKAIEEQIAVSDLNGAVFLPGFCQYESLPSYYALAGALVLASTTEQWGLAVNEAMAAGLPILVSKRCGCTPELVQEGVNGFTFDPSEEAALTKALTRLAASSPDTLQDMGAASQDIISQWSLARFAGALWQSAALACEEARLRPWKGLGRVLRRGILMMLTLRR